MPERESTHERERRPDNAEEIIQVLRTGQVDAVIGSEKVSFLRLADTEDRLQRSESRLRIALDACGGGIYEHMVPLDESTYFSDRWAEILGYSRYELPPYDAFLDWYFDRVHPDDWRSLHEVHGKFLTARTATRDLKMRIRHKDGHWLWIRDVAHAVERNDEGGVRRLIGVIFDITSNKQNEIDIKDSRAAALNLMEDAVEARRRTEDAIRAQAASEAQLRLILEHSRDGIYQIGLHDGRYEFVSPAIEQLLGFTIGELMGMKREEMDRRLHPHDREAFRRYLDEFLANGSPHNPIEYRWKIKSGDFRWFSDSRSVVTDDGGRPIALVGVIRDITQRKLYEDELQRLNLTLEERVAERTAVAEQRVRKLQAMAGLLSRVEEHERSRLAQILHDGLQQHLVAVRIRIGRLDRLQNDPGRFRDALAEAEQLLVECATQCRELSHNLVPQVPDTSNLREALETLRHDKKIKYGLDVKFEVADDLVSIPERLTGFLFRALRELLFNVVKYSGTLSAKVILDRDKGNLIIKVIDAGRGFDPSILAQGNPGAGLGLFGLRQRVELMDGQVQLESAPGKGCAVSIVVPDGCAHAGRSEDLLPGC